MTIKEVQQNGKFKGRLYEHKIHYDLYYYQGKIVLIKYNSVPPTLIIVDY